RTAHVHRIMIVEFVSGSRFQRTESTEAGVKERAVDLRRHLGHFARELRRRFGLAGVVLDRDYAVAELAPRLRERFLARAGDDYLRALILQALRRREADARSAARDQHGLALESFHALLLASSDRDRI